MCCSKGYGFEDVLVWNRVWILTILVWNIVRSEMKWGFQEVHLTAPPNFRRVSPQPWPPFTKLVRGLKWAMSTSFSYTFWKVKSQINCIVENLKVVVQFCSKTLYKCSRTINKCHLARGGSTFSLSTVLQESLEIYYGLLFLRKFTKCLLSGVLLAFLCVSERNKSC